MPRRRRDRRPAALTPRAKVWLERDGKYVFGLGISKILAAVDATGSIKAAAAEVGYSYRYVWSRVKDVERDLGVTLVATRVGGADARRSQLTPEARELVRRFGALRARVFREVDKHAAAVLDALRASNRRSG